MTTGLKVFWVNSSRFQSMTTGLNMFWVGGGRSSSRLQSMTFDA